MPSMKPDIHTYYSHTRFDYHVAWINKKNLSLHFGFYDEHADKHADALANMNRVMADSVGIMPGERVLDAGCGMGGSCFWLAENRGVQPVGVTPVASQIADCQKFAQARGLTDKVTFVQADYRAMPFADGSFDVVWACESQCHCPEKADFYREVFRVLRPGGRLVVADYVRTARPLSPAQERLIAEWLHPQAIPDIDTRTEHEQAAAAAGFAQVDVRDITPNVRVSLRNLHEICSNWLWWGKLLRFFRLISAVRLGNVRASIRQYEAVQAGAWFYALVTARKEA